MNIHYTCTPQSTKENKCSKDVSQKRWGVGPKYSIYCVVTLLAGDVGLLLKSLPSTPAFNVIASFFYIRIQNCGIRNIFCY